MLDKPPRDTMMRPAATKEAATEAHFFPGGGEYLPQTVHARTREEAIAEYERTRKPVPSGVSVAAAPSNAQPESGAPEAKGATLKEKKN